MPTRVIMIDFNPEVSLEQMKVFQQEVMALADKISYKKSFHCGFNRTLTTEPALDAVAREVDVHVAQFAAIWEFGPYDDLNAVCGRITAPKFCERNCKISSSSPMRCEL